MNDRDDISYQLVLLADEERTWYRSDGSGITGTWSDWEGDIYLNFDDPDLDYWNSGVYKGFRIFKKKVAVPEWWECVKPQW